MGITNDGKEAERLFCAITKATAQAKGASADALLEGHEVEVKKVSAGTLNQVRPMRYHTIVAWDPAAGRWYVIPANRIVEAAAKRRRGQHTENPLECCTIHLDEFEDCRISEDELRVKTLEAARAAAQDTDLITMMTDALNEVRVVALRQRHVVQELLARRSPQQFFRFY